MSTQMTPEIKAAWETVVARSWADERFKRSLIESPNKVLAETGIALPKGVNFVVVENEPDRVHLVLPARPSGDVSVKPLDRSSVSDYDPGF